MPKLQFDLTEREYIDFCEMCNELDLKKRKVARDAIVAVVAKHKSKNSEVKK